MEIQSYRDLNVWKKSMNLVLEVYRLSKLFPRDEQFGLTSQIRRAAVSIPANVAEGHGRLHIADYLSHDQVAEAKDISAEVGRILNGLIRSLIEKNGDSTSRGRIAEDSEPYETDWSLIPDP